MNDHIHGVIDDKSPSMYGILAGICKGERWSFRDDPLVLDVMYSYCVGGCGVVGRIPNEKKKQARIFFETVFSSLKEKNICEFEFSTEDSELCTVILDVFSDKELYSEEEYSYRKSDYCNYNAILPSYAFLEIDRDFLKMSDKYENVDMLFERLNNSWHCQEDFLECSKCFVALQGKKIVGIIFGSARFSNIIDVDIEVLEEHRNKGIATALIAHFVNACVRIGCIVQWDCVESNVKSQAVAEKCGFQLFKKRPYYWFKL
jgi:Acetyltransferases, including N-acetylases of ribosomal proteins